MVLCMLGLNLSGTLWAGASQSAPREINLGQSSYRPRRYSLRYEDPIMLGHGEKYKIVLPFVERLFPDGDSPSKTTHLALHNDSFACLLGCRGEHSVGRCCIAVSDKLLKLSTYLTCYFCCCFGCLCSDYCPRDKDSN